MKELKIYEKSIRFVNLPRKIRKSAAQFCFGITTQFKSFMNEYFNRYKNSSLLFIDVLILDEMFLFPLNHH